MKARFENQSNVTCKRRTSSSAASDHEDGRKLSHANIKSRFEARISDQAPVKRNFVVSTFLGALKLYLDKTKNDTITMLISLWIGFTLQNSNLLCWTSYHIFY